LTAHAKLGPSSLARVSRCPASFAASEGLPNESSIFAAEGTLLHEIAAECLELGLEPEHYFGQVRHVDGFTFVIGTGRGQTDPTCINVALDWLRDQPGELFVETKVSLDRWMPGQFGTCDVGIWQPDRSTAIIFDWKFGMGVMVDTVGNEQLRAYALGFYLTILEPRGIKPEWFEIIIEQPRGSGGARFYEPWTISFDELMAYGDILTNVWERANDPCAPFCAGQKQCVDGFCRVKDQPPQNPGDLTGCPVYDEFNLATICLKLDDVDEAWALGHEPELPTNLTGERRWWIVKHASMFEKWLARLHEDSLAAAERGDPDPGSKRVAGRRGARDWTEDPIEELVLEYRLVSRMGQDAYVHKLKSPAQAEKDLATRRGKKAYPDLWDSLSPLIVQGEAKPILVSEDDPRPALMSVHDKFEESDEDGIDDLLS